MEDTKQAEYSIGTPTDLRTGTLSDIGLSSWERGKVFPKIFDNARDDDGNIQPSVARRSFLIVNNDELDTQSGYKFPIAVPNGSGTLIVTEAGVNAANSRLGAAINNPADTPIPLEVLQRARTRLDSYREEFQETDKGESITDTPKEKVYAKLQAMFTELEAMQKQLEPIQWILESEPNSTKDLEEAIAVGNYRQEGTPEKSCANCGFNNDGFCERFSFVHGGSSFVSDVWKPMENVASVHRLEDREDEEDKAEIKHQSKFSLIKAVFLDWLESAFNSSKSTQEIKLDVDSLVEIEEKEEKTIIPTDEIEVDDSPTTSMKIFKNKSGRYVFIGRYSNNFRDNDNVREILTQDAHRDFAKRVTDGEVRLPELWIYHGEPTKLGDATHVLFDDNGKGQGFSMVFGLFDKDKHYMAEALSKSPKSLAMSHGYGRHPVERKASDKTLITKYTSHEVSIVAPEDAANKLTTFNTIGDKPMIENKEEIADALGIEVSHLETLEADNGKATELVSEVIESKTVAQTTKQEDKIEQVESKTNETENPELLETLALLVESNKAIQAEMVGLKSTVESQAETIKSLKQHDDEKLAKIADELSPASLGAILADARGLSAVGRVETKVKGSTRYGKDKPEMNEDNIPEGAKSGHWLDS